MLEEVLVGVEGYPNYAVTNLGRVINVRRDKDLTPTLTEDGYLQIGLYRNGVCTKVLLHRVVAKAFFLNYEEGIAVNHKNGNYQDCTVLNLTISRRKCRRGES